MSDISLRTIFNQAAREYNTIRPGYPQPLLDDVLALSGIPPVARLLEIGCGTGQATRPLARMGHEGGRCFQIDCLDIGPDLLILAQENLRAYPDVRFHNISFEAYPEEASSYDLLYSATAFHWVPPEVGYPKAAHLLKPGGSLAIFSNEHPEPYTGFPEEVQAVYDHHTPEMSRNNQTAPRRLHTEAEIWAAAASIDALGLFEPVITRTYPWTQKYTTQEYLMLLNTYSGHRNLEESRRNALYHDIAGLIDCRYDGVVEKNYLAVLFLARKPLS